MTPFQAMKYRRSTAGGDPYFAFVSWLLHFDNTLLDSSPQNATFTASGNATVSTTSPIMGTGSLLLDGTTDYISAPDRNAYTFDAVPFTVEWLFRPNGTPTAYDTIVGQHSSSSNLWKFDMGLGGVRPRFVVVAGGVARAEYTTASALTLTSGIDYAMAWVRDGSNNIAFYLDGVAQSLTVTTAIGSYAIPDFTASLVIGYDPINAGRDVNGRLDEMRGTIGAARYTSNYTTAALPFPNF